MILMSIFITATNIGAFKDYVTASCMVVTSITRYCKQVRARQGAALTVKVIN